TVKEPRTGNLLPCLLSSVKLDSISSIVLPCNSTVLPSVNVCAAVGRRRESVRKTCFDGRTDEHPASSAIRTQAVIPNVMHLGENAFANPVSASAMATILFFFMIRCPARRWRRLNQLVYVPLSHCIADDNFASGVCNSRW